MTCSLQIYRSRIGTFNFRPTRRLSTSRPPSSSTSSSTFVLTLLMVSYCGILLNASTLSNQNSLGSNEPFIRSLYCGAHSTGTWYSEQVYVHVWDPCIGTEIRLQQEYLAGRGLGRVQDIRWDEDTISEVVSNGTPALTWLDRRQRNKLTHSNNGNGGQRGKGIKCLYWNKGPAHLINKQLDIETIISTHKPHILGLGEANFRHDHHLADVQQPGYSLHVDSCIDNPALGMARVAVYTHSSLRVKRRADLEDSTVSAVWLECGLPNQKSILVCVGYRQWRLLGQTIVLHLQGSSLKGGWFF